jgi:lipopolysaccharide transport system ATP-binding protein
MTMPDVAIRVENIGKRFRIGQTVGYGSLRDTLTGLFQRTIGRAYSQSKTAHENIWALKDVSFEVKRGEAVGVIGRNGSGKSTLLKILSRITSPTEGYAEIRGRAGSLLEVGTGFHPELSGRENIYLNGAVLGMRKTDIDRKMEAIVTFSEIGEFLDTPVKRYSSGMYVRLAFAVAAHMEPDILLVDEVLAVGDAAFQKKCLGKMDEVTRQGRTVLFVSHSAAAVEALCPRAIWLDAGHVRHDSASHEALSIYMGAHADPAGRAAA